ncbi:hypothetical protein CAPTEDRAFT_200929 [Capitella teleta]|uniref:glutathione gamma-glutamylcysteinyltransferase n=1 Tax=Capitella teleta TaxID=283909 RepID=R7TVZ7_CAPTE|nr:hypothetical protein CAPTEDRAFT_200929 [Capitella teleta]|eukprot:ELT98083.1 hypothetical protein CAPTEDRAFT_200929 [Capitella teleta]
MSLIRLHSDEGQRLLHEAQLSGSSQPFLGESFSKQSGSASCGVQSVALLLSAALHSDPPLTDNDLLKSPQITEYLTNKTNFPTGAGLSLEEVHELIMQCGHEADIHFASDCSISEFRSMATALLSDATSQVGVIVNYHMGTLGQDSTYGHHSPLGAYHKTTDRFLIYDCWPETLECWATASDLHGGMLQDDSDSGKPRGFIVIRKFTK